MTVLEHSKEESQSTTKTQGFLSSQERQNKIIKTIAYTLLIIGGLTMVVPFAWMISTSLKTAAEIYQGNFPPSISRG